MARIFLLFLFLLGLALPPSARAQATQLNFSEHIAPIIYSHCARCHRPGEVGPFSLLSYQDVASRGTTIAAVTGSGYMPPWKPDPTYRHYLDENTLSATEITSIRSWVSSGMPPGDPALAPPTPTFPTGSQLGTPDLVVVWSRRMGE